MGDQDLREVPQTYLMATKDFDEEMLMTLVWAKNQRIPSVLQDGGSGVNIITNTLMQKLELENHIEVAPFIIKIANQRKVVMGSAILWAVSNER